MAFDCAVHLRNNPQQHKKLVRIGCGAGFAGDRPFAALKLLLKVPDMHYLVLECLAERTLAIHHEALMAGGKGYDPRISEWMQLLLPEAVRRNVCIITNMGGVDPEGAQEEVLKAAKQYELHISVGVVCEVLADSIGRFQYLLGSSSNCEAARRVQTKCDLDKSSGRCIFISGANGDNCHFHCYPAIYKELKKSTVFC